MLNITLNFNFADLIKAAKAEAAPENKAEAAPENEEYNGLTYEQLKDTYEAYKEFEAETLEKAAAQTRAIMEKQGNRAETAIIKAETANEAIARLEKEHAAKAAKRPKKAKTNAKKGAI